MPGGIVHNQQDEVVRVRFGDSHAEGYETRAGGFASHVEGYGSFEGVHIMGQFGTADMNDSWFLANGGWTRGLAAKILRDGNAYISTSPGTAAARTMPRCLKPSPASRSNRGIS